MNLGTLETNVGAFPSTVVEKQTQGKWEVKVDAKDVSFDGSAKASSNFKINQILDEGAAWKGWW